MASPNHDNNHILLSRKLLKPVSAATSDNGAVTSGLRNDYLNKANTFIQRFFRTMEDKRPGISGEWLQGLFSTQSIAAFALGGVPVLVDYSYALSCRKFTPTPVAELFYVDPIKWIRASEPVTTNFLSSVFTVLGGSVYALAVGSILITGTGALYYIKRDQMVSAANATDIGIDSIWYDVVVDIAATFHFEDKGDFTFADAQAKRTQMILSLIGNV